MSAIEHTWPAGPTACTDDHSPLDPETTDYLLRSVRVAAIGIQDRTSVARQDLEDVCSDIALHVLRQLPRHDPAKASLKTFIAVLARAGARQWLRHHRTAKRRFERDMVSLDAPVARDDEGDPLTLLDALEAGGSLASCGHRAVQMRCDLCEALGDLDARLVDCCLGLMEGRTSGELARAAGMPRSTYRDGVIRPLRDTFAAAGLCDWLQQN